MEKNKERVEFEQDNEKNELVDRFLHLSREASHIDNEMLSICCEIEQKFGTNMEQEINARNIKLFVENKTQDAHDEADFIKFQNSLNMEFSDQGIAD